MFYYLFITGCYQNYYDAKHITHLIEKMGYVLVSEKKADMIIAIACSIRQKPIDRIFGKIKNWQSYPQKPKIIITGCVLPSDRKKIENKVDAFIEINEFKNKLPQLLNCQNHKSIKKNITKKQCIDNIVPADITADTCFVPIMSGCDNFCSYCAVPYTRGREKSRNEKEIISEIKQQITKGKKKIILLGQNVNSYKLSDLRFKLSDKIIPFVELLEKVNKLNGDFKFNFTSPNPQDFDNSLINTLPKLKKWERILHLPLQSGDNDILKKMNRKYTVQKYTTIINDLKLKIKNLLISTDIMVGFPSETKKQFQNTVDLCKKIGFYKIFTAKYSPRKGTLAEKEFNDVPHEEKKRRWKIINDLINKTTCSHTMHYRNTTDKFDSKKLC